MIRPLCEVIERLKGGEMKCRIHSHREAFEQLNIARKQAKNK